MPTKAQTPAERQRRLRYRRQHDLILAQAEMPVSLAEAEGLSQKTEHEQAIFDSCEDRLNSWTGGN